MKLFAIVILVLVSSAYVYAGILGAFPIDISQHNSTVPSSTGNSTNQTQAHLFNQSPVLKTLTHVIDGVTKIQEKFINSQLKSKSFTDGLPVIGHIKGLLHMAAGNEKEGRHIIYDANSNTAAIAGAAIAGPIGIASGKLISDAISSGIESIVEKK